MKKPTKKQRHDIYIKMFENIERFVKSDYSVYLCHQLVIINKYLDIANFPELMKHKQYNGDTLNVEPWFPDTKRANIHRLFIVRQAIEETK